MKPSTERVSSYFMSFLVKLSSDTAFFNLSVISMLLIFNVIASLVRYNRSLNSNQAILTVSNRLLSI